jgi:hypothetical protein
MIVYHGSNHNFKTLKIGKNLVENQSSLENEGIGIYFSKDKEIAKSYGKYLYTLEINPKYYRDFREMTTCTMYYKQICAIVLQQTGVDIYPFLNAKDNIARMNNGNVAIAHLGSDLLLQLDNIEKFYFLCSETKRNEVYSLLKRIDRNIHLAYHFTYNIPDVGVAKSVDPDVIRIINKERIC